MSSDVDGNSDQVAADAIESTAEADDVTADMAGASIATKAEHRTWQIQHVHYAADASQRGQEESVEKRRATTVER